MSATTVNRQFVIALLFGSACLGGALLWERPWRGGMPDFTQWPAGDERKQQFFAYLRPLLEAENTRIRQQRARLQRIALEHRNDRAPGWRDRRWLIALARDYALGPEALDPQQHDTGELLDALLLRVDVIPVSLGLAQAAKESGWGTSRFATQGHALFGQQCFERGCGLVPDARPDGLRHEVRVFDSAAAAVTAYARNLNTHRDYARLREMRAALRTEEAPVTGFVLVEALQSYSERGDAYVREVQQLIRFNDLGPVP